MWNVENDTCRAELNIGFAQYDESDWEKRTNTM
jgi:hypothetical protein